MSFSVFSFRRSAVPAAVAFAAVVCCFASTTLLGADSPSGSDAGSGSASVSSGSASAEFQSPERHVNLPDRPRSFGDMFNGNSSSQPFSAPPRPAYVPRQRSTSLLDDPNWGLVRPEDIVQDYMTREILKIPDYGPDGRDRSSMTVLERYYDRQDHSSKTPEAPPTPDSFNPANLFNGSNDRSRGIGNISGINPNNLNDFANPNLIGNQVRPEALSSLLGLKNNPLNTDQFRERQANERQMEAFKRALDYQSPAATTPIGADSLTRSITPSPSSGQSWSSSSSGFAPVMPRNPFDPVAGTYNPALATAAPIAPIAPTAPSAPGQEYSSSHKLPLSTTPVAPPKMDFSLPQRRF